MSQLGFSCLQHLNYCIIIHLHLIHLLISLDENIISDVTSFSILSKFQQTISDHVRKILEWMNDWMDAEFVSITQSSSYDLSSLLGWRTALRDISIVMTSKIVYLSSFWDQLEEITQEKKRESWLTITWLALKRKEVAHIRSWSES